MQQNAYLLAKIGADTAENERNLPKFCQKLATALRVGPRSTRVGVRHVRHHVPALVLRAEIFYLGWRSGVCMYRHVSNCKGDM